MRNPIWFMRQGLAAWVAPPAVALGVIVLADVALCLAKARQRLDTPSAVKLTPLQVV
jgi:hypothetical protein